jgi:hypothetical protein
MTSQIQMLLAAPRHLHLPPGLKQTMSTQPIQSSYSMELDRTANAILRKSANRLREAKMIAEQVCKKASSNGEIRMTTTTDFSFADRKTIPSQAFISYSWDDE